VHVAPADHHNRERMELEIAAVRDMHGLPATGTPPTPPSGPASAASTQP
jgi:hypothetical protein